MENYSDFDAVGIFDTRFKAFLEAAGQLRPQLHRYCARMAGSVMDGEDIMQEVLFEAYRKLGEFDDDRPIGPGYFGSPTIDALTFFAAIRSVGAPNASPPFRISHILQNR